VGHLAQVDAMNLAGPMFLDSGCVLHLGILPYSSLLDWAVLGAFVGVVSFVVRALLGAFAPLVVSIWRGLRHGR
jgi:hypothetical protein